MFNANPFKDIFGLDISDTVIRLAHLKKYGDNIGITTLNEIYLPDGIIFDGDIKDEAKLRQYLDRLVKKPRGKKISTKYVNCVIPERKTFIKLIQIPKTRKAELDEAIKWESSQHIPMNPEEIFLDWQVLNHHEDKIYILIAAAPKSIVNSYTEILESVDLTPISLETESLATIRSISPGQGKSFSPCLIVDIGGDHTNLIIYDEGSIQFSSSLPFSGGLLTKAISEKLKLSLADAEKAKIIYGLEAKKAKGEIRKTLTPYLSDLVAKIKESENFYTNHFPTGQKFKKVVVSGGGAQLKLLDEFMAKKLGLSVDKANPTASLSKKKSKVFPSADRVPSFTTAIGLALKNII